MAPPPPTHSASMTMHTHQGSIANPTLKKNLTDLTTSPAISLCSLGRASHEYEDIQQ